MHSNESDSKGKGLQKGHSFSVTVGEFWLFMGYHLYTLCHPADLPTQEYWEGSLSTKYKTDAFFNHDLWKFGIGYYCRFRRLLQAFALAQYPIVDGQTDPFAFIRRFADEWNIQMLRCVTPSCILVVDGSMGQWLGKGMPRLMYVARKPTQDGREGHTVADSETGRIIRYEIYVGKALMADKEYVKDLLA